MKTKTEKELEREIENAQFSVPYTYKNFPFLIEMRKDDWIVNQHNKAILINAFKRGKLEGYRLAKEEFNKKLDKLIFDLEIAKACKGANIKEIDKQIHILNYLRKEENEN